MGGHAKTGERVALHCALLGSLPRPLPSVLQVDTTKQKNAGNTHAKGGTNKSRSAMWLHALPSAILATMFGLPLCQALRQAGHHISDAILQAGRCLGASRYTAQSGAAAAYKAEPSREAPWENELGFQCMFPLLQLEPSIQS